jgi:hypothetical protein
MMRNLHIDVLDIMLARAAHRNAIVTHGQGEKVPNLPRIFPATMPASQYFIRRGEASPNCQINQLPNGEGEFGNASPSSAI